ncbi:hypothetical protein Tco_1419846 [Tanacetum coccineum]
MSFVTMADEITLESLTKEQFECFIEYHHENYPEDFKSDLENLEEIYKMMNGGVEYPHTQNASPSEIKEPYEPSPRMHSYEQPSCLGLNFIGRKAHLLEDKQIPSVGLFDEVFSIWKAFEGNTRDLGSFGEETDKTTDLHQNLLKNILIERGDGVASIKRRHYDLRSNDVSTLVTPSEHGRPKGTLEDSVSRD